MCCSNDFLCKCQVFTWKGSCLLPAAFNCWSYIIGTCRVFLWTNIYKSCTSKTKTIKYRSAIYSSVVTFFKKMVQENNPYCELWNGTFTEVFHGASLIFGVAFSVPQNFEQSFLVLRMLLNVALFIMGPNHLLIWWHISVKIDAKPPIYFLIEISAYNEVNNWAHIVFWSLNTVCMAPDLFLWNSAFTLINLIYVFALIKKHFPTFIPSYLMNYYTVVLKPLLVSQKVCIFPFLLDTYL